MKATSWHSGSGWSTCCPTAKPHRKASKRNTESTELSSIHQRKQVQMRLSPTMKHPQIMWMTISVKQKPTSLSTSITGESAPSQENSPSPRQHNSMLPFPTAGGGHHRCLWLLGRKTIFYFNKSCIWVKYIGQLLETASESNPEHDNHLRSEGRFGRKAQTAPRQTQMVGGDYTNTQTNKSVSLRNQLRSDR